MFKTFFIWGSLILTVYCQNWGEYIENDWTQTKSKINSKTLLLSGGWFAGMYLLSYSDEYLNDNVKQINKGYLKPYFKTIDNLGYAPIAIPLSFGITGISLLTNDTKFRRTALTSLESMIATSAIVYSLKIMIGRKRPFEKKGAHFFDPFSGFDDSFPSGHSSTAFAIVTPWVYYYRKPWTYFLFLFPASTAIARMIYDEHWATDVLTGSVIGYAVGYYLTQWHKEYRKSQKSNQIPPMVNFTLRF